MTPDDSALPAPDLDSTQEQPPLPEPDVTAPLPALTPTPTRVEKTTPEPPRSPTALSATRVSPATQRGRRKSYPGLWQTAVLILALLVSAVSWNWFVQSIHARSSVALPTPVVTVTEQPPTSPKESPPANNLTLIAHLPGDVPAYSEPGIPTGGTVAGEWWDYPSILPVLEERDGFYKVRIQQRPNGSTVWIAAEGIETSVTPYRMVIDVTKYRVILFELGKVVLDVPAMVGREHTPTPVGEFFVTMLYPGSSPGYGKQMVVLSAHSETIDDWQGSGDAITAIHGPLGNEASIDTVGAGSNGCVRLHMADLDALVALVVPGTPVDIVAS